jgi:hypothetical protein
VSEPPAEPPSQPSASTKKATSVGAVLMARTPETLVDDTDVTGPSRQAGSLCLGAALPLLTYGARLQWDVWRGAKLRGH